MTDGNVAAAELDALRWKLLRWAPRADSGVLLASEPLEGGEGLVDVATLSVALPVMALTGDYAPVDMQYRMHRELLWDEQTGLWAAAASVDSAGERLGERPTPDASSTTTVADALETALRIGQGAVPEEMRGRWTRQAAELRETLRI